MSEIPEITALRRDRVFAPYPEATHLVRLDDAERELRSALDRQAREIVEALREKADEQDGPDAFLDAAAYRVSADLIERDFCPEEGDRMPTPQPAPEVIMDANGNYWRRYEDGTLSMCPVSTDNLPLAEPVVVYSKEGDPR